MIASRPASVMALQPPISDRVRKQPRHRLEAPSTTQTWMQGVEMDRGTGRRGGGVFMTISLNTVRYRSKNLAFGAGLADSGGDAKRLRG